MVKIKDVAKFANVSETTVSRVLNEDKEFSTTEETRKRIYDAVNQLGYKSLRQKKKSNTKQERKVVMGVLWTTSQEDEFNDPYYRSIRIGIERQCADLHIVFKVIRVSPSISNSNFEDVDGLIVVGSIDVETLKEFYYENENIILVNNLVTNDPRYDAIVSDLDVAAAQCIETLYNLGHREIGYIGGQENIKKITTDECISVPDIRQSAFEKKMHELSLLNKENIYIGDWSAAEGFRLMQEAILKGDLPSAFIVGSDPISMGVIHALRESSIRVPEDVSIISFDDIEAAAFMSPPLSTVKVCTEEIGRQAVKVLADRIQGREVPVKVIVPSQLIVRKSFCEVNTERGQ